MYYFLETLTVADRHMVIEKVDPEGSTL